MKKRNVLLVLGCLLIAMSGCHYEPHPEGKSSHQVQTPHRETAPTAQVAAPVPLTDQASVQRLAEPAMMRNKAMFAGAKMAPASYRVPIWNTESYNAVKENGFINTMHAPLSTFSIDVDTASYANVRRFINDGRLPPVGAVRIEELVNYFSYDYPKPGGNQPFALSGEVAPSPYHEGYLLARIALQAKELPKKDLPPSNLVFLIDVSGSMQANNKLPLLQRVFPLLVDQMGRRDRVSIVVYAGADSVVLQPTAGDRHQAIINAINHLQAGGSTHASSGIRTAYELARKTFIRGGNNRVILASDGDFNVGVTSRDELARLIENERRSGVYLTVLGFGMGNYHDDTMEILADKGNGNYAYIDSFQEAKKVLVKEMSGTLFTLANDVKIQVEFNPARVGAYRLLGYENRALANEDFKDDTKDAGEVGVGHRVTALYELIPEGHKDIPQVDPLKYQQVAASQAEVQRKNIRLGSELMTVKLRYKPKGKSASVQMSLVVGASDMHQHPSTDFRFAAAVAGYGMLLTHSPYLGAFTWERCQQLAREGRGADDDGNRAEFYRLVETSALLAGQPEAEAPDQTRPVPMPLLRRGVMK